MFRSTDFDSKNSLSFNCGVLVGGRNEGRDASDGFVQIGVDDGARGFLDFAHGSCGAFLRQTPKADKNESAGE